MTSDFDEEGRTPWYTENNVELLLNDKAVAIDTKAKTVTGASGKVVSNSLFLFILQLLDGYLSVYYMDHLGPVRCRRLCNRIVSICSSYSRQAASRCICLQGKFFYSAMVKMSLMQQLRIHLCF